MTVEYIASQTETLVLASCRLVVGQIVAKDLLLFIIEVTKGVDIHHATPVVSGRFGSLM